MQRSRVMPACHARTGLVDGVPVAAPCEADADRERYGRTFSLSASHQLHQGPPWCCLEVSGARCTVARTTRGSKPACFIYPKSRTTCPPDRRFACAKRVSSAAPVARQSVKQAKMQQISDRLIAKIQSYRPEIGRPAPVTLRHSLHFCDIRFETFFNGNCFLAFFSATGPPLTAGRSIQRQKLV